MWTFTFKGKNGKLFSGKGKDADRARSAAKKAAGTLWDPSAKLVSVRNAI